MVRDLLFEKNDVPDRSVSGGTKVHILKITGILTSSSLKEIFNFIALSVFFSSFNYYYVKIIKKYSPRNFDIFHSQLLKSFCLMEVLAILSKTRKVLKSQMVYILQDASFVEQQCALG